MCGIVGFSGFNDPTLLQRMNDSIIHRGPDDDGFVTFKDSKTSLAMRRLSIIDAQGGQQPFKSPCGQVTLVFNGEIYNFQDLKKTLKKQNATFTSESDTEVVLQSYLRWGLDCLNHLHGMFAFALYDERGDSPKLIIARDRVGMKPLYYSHIDDKLLFGSDIKALLCSDIIPRNIHLPSIKNYLTYRFVPKPHTLFAHIRKLPAAHVMIWEDNKLQIKRWWSPPAPTPQNPKQNDKEALQSFEKALNSSVKNHMISDVPVGVFLSGGVDSTIIAALMAKHHTGQNKINSYTACFPDYTGNEGLEAQDTAQHLGMDSHLVECRPQNMEYLPQIVRDLDEPVGDAIVLPMWLLSQETRAHNKVILSGEGADEILGGYMFHKNLIKIEKLKAVIPKALWPALGRLFALIPLPILNQLFDYPGTFGIKGREKLSQFLKNVPNTPKNELLTRLISLFDNLDFTPLQNLNANSQDQQHMSDLSHFTQLHYDGWLEDNILWKSDKMTMAHSVEGRMPFMDENVLKMAAQLPDHLKLNAKGNKWALRQYAQKLLPDSLLNRPKKAFYVPLEHYKNHKMLQDLYREHLSEDRITKRGLFKHTTINALLHPKEKDGFLPDKQAFAILMLELWFENFCPDWQHDGTAIM